MKKLYNKAKNDLWVEQDVCMSVIARYGTGGGNVPIMVETSAISIGNGQLNQISMSDKSNALDCMHDKQAVIVRSVDTSHADDVVRISNDSVPSLQGRSYKGGNNIQTKSVVRRLTPLECERLQGMPDNWSKYGLNEKEEVYELSDSARYRLQGNGIATPFWRWMMKRISAQYERNPTLGSLFDGQGSFPMIWEGINGSGTALWSSEIEKHAVAVAKYHFPEEE